MLCVFKSLLQCILLEAEETERHQKWNLLPVVVCFSTNIPFVSMFNGREHECLFHAYLFKLCEMEVLIEQHHISRSSSSSTLLCMISSEWNVSFAKKRGNPLVSMNAQGVLTVDFILKFLSFPFSATPEAGSKQTSEWFRRNDDVEFRILFTKERRITSLYQVVFAWNIFKFRGFHRVSLISEWHPHSYALEVTIQRDVKRTVVLLFGEIGTCLLWWRLLRLRLSLKFASDSVYQKRNHKTVFLRNFCCR
jgi:hypothetical protein